MRTAGLTLTVAAARARRGWRAGTRLRAAILRSSGEAGRRSPRPRSRGALPRTPDGRPDLQGNWTNATITPLERLRPNTPLVITEEAARARRDQDRSGARGARSAERSESRRAAGRRRGAQEPERRADLPRARCGRPAPAPSAATTRSGSIRAIACCASTASRAARSSSIRRTAACPATPTRRARAWRRRRRSARRRAASSIIPSCGRSPSAASRRSAATPGRRCCRTTSTTTATRIVQTKDTVVILTEMVHDARVVRMGGTHPPASVRKWFGDSIGRWEGDTLVIETTNFHPSTASAARGRT